MLVPEEQSLSYLFDLCIAGYHLDYYDDGVHDIV